MVLRMTSKIVAEHYFHDPYLHQNNMKIRIVHHMKCINISTNITNNLKSLLPMKLFGFGKKRNQ